MEIVCQPAGVFMDAGKRYLVTCGTPKCKQRVRRVVGTPAGPSRRPGAQQEWEWVQVEPCMHTDGVKITEDMAYTTKWRGRQLPTAG